MVSASAVLTGSYDYGEVARSVLIAIVASYAALDLAGRVTAAKRGIRLAWLSGGAIAMGIGIWAMHFKGMLAFHLPVPVEYHWPTVLASLLVAVLASAVALYVVSRRKMSVVEGVTGSVIMGAGVASMHYIGMAAMRLPAITRFSPLLVAISILLAILFSLIALLMAFDLREETRWTVPRRLGSAIVMGAAISAMHYTGMAAATFIPASPPDLSHAVSISPFFNSGVAVAALIVLVAAMATSSLDRRQSEGHLRLVTDTTPAMLLSARPDGYVDYFSKHGLEYLGLSLDDMCGWRWTSVIHPDDVEEDIGRWRSSLATGKPFEAEIRVRRADGEYRWMLNRHVPARDSQGNIIKWYGSGVDIEDRKRAEDALRESEERFRAIFENAGVGVALVDWQGHPIKCNPTLQRMLGFTEDELRNKAFTEFTHPDDMDRDWKLYAEVLAGKRDKYEIEKRYITKDGRVVWGNLIVSLMKNKDGTPADYMVGMVEDITERRRAEEQMRQAQLDLARVTHLATLGEMATAIAHEVNQPLGAVVTNGSASLRWLAGQPPNLEEAREAIERTVREANRASEVIRRIRALVQKGPPQMERLDVNAVIREVLTLAGTELLRGGVAVQTELASDVPNVFGDRVQLQQVLMNLIMNGVDAMSTITDRPRELLVKSSTHANGVLIQVQDSGEGVDPKQADHIFDPFFTTKPQGIGMGLSISRSIVETHGGRLWFTPGSRHGVVFQFIVPKADTSNERAA